MKLITDGDVSGALLVTDEKYEVDIFLGIGGGPEEFLLHQLWMHLIVIFKVDFCSKQARIKQGLKKWVLMI